jgi:large subunit ribosomal protein L35
MPKIKTLQGAAKRFKVTGTGKIRRFRAAKSHLLTGKPRRRKRSLRPSAPVVRADASRIRKLIPYR